jgi:hypothetical protein
MLVGFIDSHWANELNAQNPAIGYVFSLGFGLVT